MTLTNSERVDKQQLVGIQHSKNEGPVIGSGGQSAHRSPICYNLLQYNIQYMAHPHVKGLLPSSGYPNLRPLHSWG